MEHRNSKEEKHLYVIAQFDAETDQRLKALYQTLVGEGFTGTQTKDIPYHITLGTFELDDEVDLIRRTHDVTKDMHAFTIRLASIGLFGLNVLFLAPAVKQQLLTLRHAIMPGGGTADEFPWVAHTTMLMDEPNTIHRAIPVLAEHFKPFRATVESVGIYEFFPERKIGIYPLRT